MRRLCAILLIAACTKVAAADPALETCGADAALELLGQPAAEVSFPGDRKVRIIRPGDAVTMDHVPERLNILLDEEDLVVGLRCG